MRSISDFGKTTLIGGLLIILPIYISLLLIAKAIQSLLVMLKPIAVVFPASVAIQQSLAVLVLAALCFVAGLVVRTGPGLRAKNTMERAVLERLPGYALLRGLAGRLTGRADEPAFMPALAEIEEALVPAFIIEELEDGSFTVLVPSVPTPLAGALYILAPERVHPIDVPLTTVLKVFSKWGTGAGELVRAMHQTRLSTARINSAEAP